MKVDDGAKDINCVTTYSSRSDGIGNFAEKNEVTVPISKRVHRSGKIDLNPNYGRFQVGINGESQIIEYEPDTNLHSTEIVVGDAQ